MIGRAALLFVFVTSVACGTDDPASRARLPRSETAQRASRPRSTAIQSDGSSIHGFPLPSGSEHKASSDLGDDYVLHRPPADVAEYVAAHVVEGEHTTRDRDLHEFRRVTPIGEDPGEIRLYIRVMSYGGLDTTSLRVQRLPVEELTPEQLRRNVEAFEREQSQLD